MRLVGQSVERRSDEQIRRIFRKWDIDGVSTVEVIDAITDMEERDAAITWALARHLRGEGPETTPDEALAAYKSRLA